MLVAPLGPKQGWFLDLFGLRVEWGKLLKQPQSSRFHPYPQDMNLHAWRFLHSEGEQKLLTEGQRPRSHQAEVFIRESGTVPLIADFLVFKFKEKKCAVSTVKGYRTAIGHVLKATVGVDIGQDKALSSLMSNLARDVSGLQKGSWDLSLVLGSLIKFPFEPCG